MMKLQRNEAPRRNILLLGVATVTVLSLSIHMLTRTDTSNPSSAAETCLRRRLPTDQDFSTAARKSKYGANYDFGPSSPDLSDKERVAARKKQLHLYWALDCFNKNQHVRYQNREVEILIRPHFRQRTCRVRPLDKEGRSTHGKGSAQDAEWVDLEESCYINTKDPRLFRHPDEQGPIDESKKNYQKSQVSQTPKPRESIRQQPMAQNIATIKKAQSLAGAFGEGTEKLKNATPKKNFDAQKKGLQGLIDSALKIKHLVTSEAWEDYLTDCGKPVPPKQSIKMRVARMQGFVDDMQSALDAIKFK